MHYQSRNLTCRVNELIGPAGRPAQIVFGKSTTSCSPDTLALTSFTEDQPANLTSSRWFPDVSGEYGFDRLYFLQLDIMDEWDMVTASLRSGAFYINRDDQLAITSPMKSASPTTADSTALPIEREPESTRSGSATVTSESGAAATTSAVSAHKEKIISNGAIAGIAVGVTGAIVLGLFLGCIIAKKRMLDDISEPDLEQQRSSHLPSTPGSPAGTYLPTYTAYATHDLTGASKRTDRLHEQRGSGPSSPGNGAAGPQDRHSA